MLILIAIPIASNAQSIIYNRFDALNKLASTSYDSSSIAFRSVISYQGKAEGDYYKILPVFLHISYNSKFAHGFNDGYLWQGRGFNQSVSLGVHGRVGRVEYTLAPILNYSENKNYNLRSDYGSNSEFQNRFTTGIDYVMQYGNGSFSELYLGQSEIAYSHPKFRVSLGTTNTFWGPAIFNQTLMSNNANGFPNLRIGSNTPWQTKAGSVEMQWVFGITKESDYFNDDPEDDHRVFNGFVFGYKPEFFPGLTVSLQRSMQLQDRDRDSWSDYFILFTDFLRTSQQGSDGSVNESADQIFSFGLDWRSSSDDFKVYMEWVRGDFASHVPDFLEQPEHNAGYVWGFVKQFKFHESRLIQLVFENANLAVWETGRVRSSGSLYQHSQITQGYTNNGQVLGAGIGPGSSFHAVNISYRNKKQSLNFEFFRTRYNDDAYYLRLFEEVGSTQDIQYYLGLHWKDWLGNVEYQIGSGVGIRDNYLFENRKVIVNLHPQVILRYHFQKK